VVPAAPAAPAKPAEAKPAGKEEAAAAPARLIVSLPAEAKLTIDDEATTSTSSTRVFVTPTLQPGKEYYYTLKADLNGQTVSKQVTIRAGQETRTSIEIPVATASK
jgi:uncharacterized protein (TIGR03000 family)